MKNKQLSQVDRKSSDCSNWRNILRLRSSYSMTQMDHWVCRGFLRFWLAIHDSGIYLINKPDRLIWCLSTIGVFSLNRSPLPSHCHCCIPSRIIRYHNSPTFFELER